MPYVAPTLAELQTFVATLRSEYEVTHKGKNPQRLKLITQIENVNSLLKESKIPDSQKVNILVSMLEGSRQLIAKHTQDNAWLFKNPQPSGFIQRRLFSGSSVDSALQLKGLRADEKNSMDPRTSFKAVCTQYEFVKQNELNTFGQPEKDAQSLAREAMPALQRAYTHQESDVHLLMSTLRPSEASLNQEFSRIYTEYYQQVSAESWVRSQFVTEPERFKLAKFTEIADERLKAAFPVSALDVMTLDDADEVEEKKSEEKTETKESKAESKSEAKEEKKSDRLPIVTDEAQRLRELSHEHYKIRYGLGLLAMQKIEPSSGRILDLCKEVLNIPHSTHADIKFAESCCISAQAFLARQLESDSDMTVWKEKFVSPIAQQGMDTSDAISYLTKMKDHLGNHAYKLRAAAPEKADVSLPGRMAAMVSLAAAQGLTLVMDSAAVAGAATSIETCGGGGAMVGGAIGFYLGGGNKLLCMAGSKAGHAAEHFLLKGFFAKFLKYCAGFTFNLVSAVGKPISDAVLNRFSSGAERILEAKVDFNDPEWINKLLNLPDSILDEGMKRRIKRVTTCPIETPANLQLETELLEKYRAALQTATAAEFEELNESDMQEAKEAAAKKEQEEKEKKASAPMTTTNSVAPSFLSWLSGGRSASAAQQQAQEKAPEPSPAPSPVRTT